MGNVGVHCLCYRSQRSLRANMDHNEHRRLQQGILDQVLLILKDDPHVLGLVFAGSCA